MQMNGQNNKVRAIIFDLGETLVNFGKVNTMHLFYEGARLSYDFLKACGQRIGNFNYYLLRNFISIHLHYWLCHLRGKDFDSLELLKKVGFQKGLRLDSNQWEHFAWLWYQPLAQAATVEPDTAQTLMSLKKSGLKLGILSNTFVHGSSLEKHLQQLGLLDFFDVCLFSYQFDCRKPSTRIFRIAAEKIGEKIENIAFIGDRIDKDIKPALRAGMKAVLKKAYTNTDRKIPTGTFRINKLAELPGIIKKINAD